VQVGAAAGAGNSTSLPPALEFKSVSDLRKATKAALADVLNVERVARGQKPVKQARACR